MQIAILGPGAVGGLLAVALEHAGTPVTLIAREPTARQIASDGIQLHSALLGDLHAFPRAVEKLTDDVDVLIVATKALNLSEALKRIDATPGLVLPLLNGLDHLALLRERFAPESVLASTIRVDASRPRQGVVEQAGKFIVIELAGEAAPQAAIEALLGALTAAGVHARAGRSEAGVMWSKLVRLCPLALTTSAYGLDIGTIRCAEQSRKQLEGAIGEASAAARSEGANIKAAAALAELDAAHPSLRSSMYRDIAAGRQCELDAIGGAVLRACKRNGIACPTVEGLMSRIEAQIAAASR